MNTGLLYVTMRHKPYLEECVASARSVKKYWPDAPIALVTDMDTARLPSGLFDTIIPDEGVEHPFKVKVKSLLKSPFERTLFLDVDTCCHGDPRGIFMSMADCDLALAPVPLIDWKTRPPVFIAHERAGVFNTGVIAYEKSVAVQDLFGEWYQMFRHQEESVIEPGKYCDQCYFNPIIAARGQVLGVRLKSLPTRIYNARTFLNQIFREEGVNDQIIISHGRADTSSHPFNSGRITKQP